MERREDQSATILRHKPDANGVEHEGQHQPDEDWSQSLQNFCFCEEGAIYKKGRGRFKSMCRFHRQRTRRGSASSKSGLNLAHVGRSHKPLVRAGRLKLATDRPPTQILCSARFNFSYKPVKPPDSGGKDPPAAPVVDSAAAPAVSRTPEAKDGTGLRASASPNSGDSGSASGESAAAPPQSLFSAAASGQLFTFSSVLPKPSDSSSSLAASRPETVPSFQGYRAVTDHRFRWPVCDQGGDSQSALPSPRSDGAGGAAAAWAPSRADLALERSCSLQARLDESEVNVTELAAYMDNLLFLPKEMSAMAQMMYA